MNPLPMIHMLWVSGELSRLARLSLASFRHHGYPVTVWSYEPQGLAGLGADVLDAAQILQRQDVGNMAWLTSLFRYRLLAEKGGIWSDMDVVALSAAPGLPEGPFIAAEKRRPFRHAEPTATGESLTQVTNCFMGNSAPKPHDLWHRAASHVAALEPDARSWENCGPHLLSRLLIEQPQADLAILPPERVDPVAWWNVPGYFLEERDPPEAPFMHMYATVWARRGVDAEVPFPSASLAGRLWRRFGL